MAQSGDGAATAEGVDAEADGEADGQEEFSKKVRPGPPMASPAERDNHEASGHAVFRSWCADCVSGRGRARPHLGKDHSGDQVPVLSWDYGFLGTKRANPEPAEASASGSPDSPTNATEVDIDEDEADSSGQSPVICLRDRASQACFWYLVPAKGTGFSTYDNLISLIIADLQWMGYTRIAFRSDGEPALLRVLADIKEKWGGEIVPEASAEGDSSSNGSAECGVGLMKGHTRSIKHGLERKLQRRIPEGHNLLTWLVRFAASSYRRFHVGSDGRTPIERLTGRRTHGPMAGFGESIWWMPLQVHGRAAPLETRYQTGFFLGYSDGSNTCLVLAAEGVVRCRSIMRTCEAERWDASGQQQLK